MDDDHGHKSSNQSLLVATSVATFVLAGSVVLLRSKLPWLSYESNGHVPENSEQHDANESTDQVQNTLIKNSRSKERRRRGKDPMKELMKGGKKAKDITKLLKSIEQGGIPSSPTATSHTQQHAQNLPGSAPSYPEKRSRSPEPSTSSRSVSSASASSSRQHVRIPDVDHDDLDDDRLADIPNEGLDKDLISQRLSRSDSHYTDSHSHYIYSTHSGMSTMHPTHSPSHSHSTSHDSTPSLSSMTTSDSVATTSTAITSVGSMSPSISMKPFDYEQAEEQEQERRKATPTRNNIPSSKSYSPKSLKDSVDYSNDIYHPSHKAPRFRTSNNSSPSSDMPTSISMSVIDHRASTLISSSSHSGIPEQHDPESAVSIDFPTLNGSSINSAHTNGSRSGDRERTSSAVHVNEVDGYHNTVNRHGNPIRRVPTPRRTPTPSTIPSSSSVLNTTGSGTGSPGSGSGMNSGRNTPPPSQSASSSSSTVSTQTQIASLRGALEAARMREEKTKGELERYAKEVEMLRWESSAWRRRENELQTHIHHLMHQLQSYAAFYMSPMAVPPPPIQSPTNGTQHLHPQHLTIPGTNGSPPGSNNGSNAPSPSLNGHQQVPLPALSGTPGIQASGVQQLQPTQHPTLENVNGLMSQPPQSQTNVMPTSPISPLGTMSPLSFSMVSTPHSPHFPYPYPIPGQSHGQGRSPYGMPMPLQMHPSHFLSMLNVNPMPTSTSASSALSMASGEDDISPDLSVNNSPSPGPKDVLAMDRGRKRLRATKNIMGELSDSWIGVGVSGEVEEEANASGSSERYDAEGEDDDEYDDRGVSGLLVDAILKRPESIRLGSGSRKKGRRREKTGSDPGTCEENVNSPSRSSSSHSSPGTPGSSESLQNSSSSESPVEFVFPSISDWGNVTKKKADVTVEPVQSAQAGDVIRVEDKGGSEGEDVTPPAALGSVQKNSAAPLEPSVISLSDPVTDNQQAQTASLEQ